MNLKILSLLAILPLLLMPVISGYAMPYDKTSVKTHTIAISNIDKMKHMEHSSIPNSYSFMIDETTIKAKRGIVTVSGHGAYNPDENTISAWGKYSIAVGSRVVKGNWNAVGLVDGKGNPYGGSSDDLHVHFIGKTASLKDTKYTGNNAKRESVMRGSHQIWIYANAAEGILCVYGGYVGLSTPRTACTETDTISIAK